MYIKNDLCSNLKTLVHGFFATNAKMVLINDDQIDIADVVLGVWLKVKKLNHPSGDQFLAPPINYECNQSPKLEFWLACVAQEIQVNFSNYLS